MMRLNEARLHTMRKHAIENLSVSRFQENGRRLLQRAEAALAEHRWDDYTSDIREAGGMIFRAYPAVIGTLNDVIKGDGFFPGAGDSRSLLHGAAAPGIAGYPHAADRLRRGPRGSDLGDHFPGPSRLRHRPSAGRPARLRDHGDGGFRAPDGGDSLQPLPARVPGAEQARVHQTDISRFSAAYTAFMLGISNMRRRKLRTSLTLGTITLLTFTVLSFSSFKPDVQLFRFFPPA